MPQDTQLSRPVYIDAAFRTPIGRFGGSLQYLSAAQLASRLLRSSIEKSKTRNADLIIMGHARQAGAGPNTARQAAIFAGLPKETPAWTVNQACASGLCAVMTGADKIQLGQADRVWAGGVESMSNTPFYLMDARWGRKLGHGQVVDGMYQDGFQCPMSEMIMGETVEENIAKAQKISRKDQDRFALESQRKANKAWEDGLFQDEVLPLDAEARHPGLERDEHLRQDSSMEKLSKLTPVFDPKGGSITAGNSSGITDGSAVLLLSSQKSKNSLAEILDYNIAGVDPAFMGLGPIPATEQLLKRNSLESKDISVFEINEAFAAQAIACVEALAFQSGQVNPRGGAIALGHPIGATGARILTTLVHTLKMRPGELGIASLCVSGGMGFSMLIRSLG